MRPRYLLPLVAAVLAGCAHRPPIAEAAPSPAPAPPPAPAAAPAEIPMPIPVNIRIALCAMQKGELVEFEAEVNLETGDTLVAGRPYTQLYPLTGEYGAVSDLFHSSLPFTFNGACYGRYGLPRVVPPSELRRVGTYRGLALFREPDDDARQPNALYLFVRPCEFQVYGIGWPIHPCNARVW